MNRAQAVDLANVIHWIRPDWQQPGIVSALLALDASYPAAALHAIRTATNPDSRTPAAINANPIPEPATTNHDQHLANQLADREASYRQRAHQRATLEQRAPLIAAARASIRPTRTGPDQEQA